MNTQKFLIFYPKITYKKYKSVLWQIVSEES